MAKELSPLQQLDGVLSGLADTDPHFYKTFGVLSKYVEGSSLVDVRLILNQLIKDGYVEKVQERKAVPVQFYDEEYCITFGGKLHYDSGGYYQRSLNDASENVRLKNLEIARQTQGKALNWLTFWIALGTLIAAIYYLTELYWKYHWFSWFHKH
jgi:hypothetical protein